MDVGINIYSKWPYEEIVDALVENGIGRTFVCIDHPQFDALMEALDKAHIIVDNFHAPFKGQNAIWSQGEDGDRILEIWCASIDACVKHHVPVLVAHVSNGRPMPEITDVGLARFDAFVAYAEKNGVTIAFENHRYLENVKFIMDRYPELGFCLDCCHEHGFTPGIRYMPLWGNRLAATHLSDNDAQCDKDMHMLPFDGIIDFDLTAREIVQSGRDVTLMLEIKPDNHERYAGMPVKEYYTEAAKRIRRVAELAQKNINAI